MKVKRLIEILQSFPQEHDIFIASEGDNDYEQAYYALLKDIVIIPDSIPEEDNDDENTTEVVVIGTSFC